MLEVALISGLAVAGIALASKGGMSTGYYECHYKALEILQNRLENGEIDSAEFEERRRAIAS